MTPDPVTSAAASRRVADGHDLAAKVPQITLLFWVIKILTTGMGETTSDYFVVAYNPILVVLVTAVLFALCFVLQFRTKRFVPWRYWLLVAMVSVFGTMVADVAHIVVGVPYTVSTVAFAVALAVVFLVWWRVEGTLSIHSITTPRRECFYWATVIVTFALGTAAGDLTARTLRLGYFASAILFLVLIAVPALAYRLFPAHAVSLFWAAYVLTRPLGASIADWLAVNPHRGGLDLGTAPVSAAALGCVALLVGVVSVRRA